MAEEAEEESSEGGEAGDLLGMAEVPAIAQVVWPDFTGSGSLMTMGMCTLCFIHAVIEVRIAANSTKDPLAPSTRFAGTCPAIREPGESEVHTLLFDVALTYTGRCEVRGGKNATRASLECLAEAFGLIDDEGEEIPEDKLERLFERVRLIAAVPYLEALEDLLRERLVAVTAAVGTDGFVAHDQYAFYRPVESWQRVNLPSQYACKRGSKRTVGGLSRCMLGTVSTGAGSVDPRGAHRLLASLLAALDLTPAPTEKPERAAPGVGRSPAGPLVSGSVGPSRIWGVRKRRKARRGCVRTMLPSAPSWLATFSDGWRRSSRPRRRPSPSPRSKTGSMMNCFTGSCLCVAFLGFQEKATGADPILNTGRGILA